MLKLEQVKALVAEGVGVFRILSTYPVREQDGVLRWGHLDDKVLTDVDTKYFREADYEVAAATNNPPALFRSVGDPRMFANGCYVVKFGGKGIWTTYVIVRYAHPIDAGQATEMAIDHLVQAGWTEVEAQPLLVI